MNSGNMGEQGKLGTDTIIVHESMIQKAVKEARLRADIENMDSDYLMCMI